VRRLGWLLPLCVFLFVWEPRKFAGELGASLGTMSMRGPGAVVELLAHAAVAALAVAAAWALWIGNPRAPALAVVALAASAVTAVQSLYWSWLPGHTMPGDHLPLALVAVAHAAAWIAYLRISRRVRTTYG
jgi:uncharacterized protein DUF2569